MKRSGGGKIINIGSMFALFGSAYAAPYAASKGALVQLTKSLAAAWALSRSARTRARGARPGGVPENDHRKRRGERPSAAQGGG